MAAAIQQPAAASADVEEYQQHIDSVFSLKRPRDIRAGLSSGAKSAAKGIALGTAGLFAAPIFGAYTDGVKGFAQGVGAGEGVGTTKVAFHNRLPMCVSCFLT